MREHALEAVDQVLAEQRGRVVEQRARLVGAAVAQDDGEAINGGLDVVDAAGNGRVSMASQFLLGMEPTYVSLLRRLTTAFSVGTRSPNKSARLVTAADVFALGRMTLSGVRRTGVGVKASGRMPGSRLSTLRASSGAGWIAGTASTLSGKANAARNDESFMMGANVRNKRLN